MKASSIVRFRKQRDRSGCYRAEVLGVGVPIATIERLKPGRWIISGTLLAACGHDEGLATRENLIAAKRLVLFCILEVVKAVVTRWER
jgi:hypothetical protein